MDVIARHYSARLAAAGSMLPELTALLEKAPDAVARAQYRRLVVADNLFGRPNLIGREKIWKALTARYTLDQASATFRLFLGRYREGASPAQRALLAYLLFNLNDPLFRDLNLLWLTERLQYPGVPLTANDLDKFFEIQRKTHPEVGKWSASTTGNIGKHYLSAIRDFGFAVGKTRKAVARPMVGSAPVLFICEDCLSRGFVPRRVLESELFRVIGLDLEGIVAALYELHSQGRIRFRMQADIVELELYRSTG